MSFFNNLIQNNPISRMIENRHQRNMNRDNLQALVMMQTGQNTQASKHDALKSLSKDGAATHQAMSGDATNMLVGMFGGSMFKSGSNTGVIGGNTTGGGGFNFMNIIVFGIIGWLAYKIFFK